MELLDPIITKILEYLALGTKFIRTFIEKLVPEMQMTLFLAIAVFATYYLDKQVPHSRTTFWVMSVLAIFLALNYV